MRARKESKVLMSKAPAVFTRAGIAVSELGLNFFFVRLKCTLFLASPFFLHHL